MDKTYWAKSMKFVYLVIFLLAIFVIIDGNKKIQMLARNPVVKEFNETSDSYKIVQATDVSTNLDSESGLVSKDYSVLVKKEGTNEEYKKIGNDIISSTRNYYGANSVGKITVSFKSKKGDVLLFDMIYAPNQ